MNPSDLTRAAGQAVTRRGFLRITSALTSTGAAALVLQACGSSASSTPVPAATTAPVQPAQPAATATSAPAAQPATATAAPAAQPAPATAVPQPTATLAAKAPAVASPVTVRATVWIDTNELDANNKMLATYQASHPNVKVEWINITGGGPYGRDKLQTMIAGGDAPDMMMLNTGQFEGLASRNVLLPLDNLVQEAKLDLGIYYPSAVEGSKYHGKLYGLPRDISNVILYYNKDLFDKAQVSYPTDAWTWNDFLQAATKLTLNKSSGKIDQWGFGLINVVWVWAGFVWANGGDILSSDRKQSVLDDPKTVEALKYYFDLQLAKKVSPPPGSLPQAQWAGDWFTSQSVAMGLFGPWFRPTLVEMKQPFKWDVAQPPKAPSTGKRGSVVYTDMWGISPTSKVPKDTFDFMQFFASSKGQLEWVDLIGARSLTPVKEVAQTPKWIGYGGSSGQIILDSLSYSQPPPVNFGDADQVENAWNKELELVIAGQETVDQAVKNINAKINPVLAKNQ